MDSSADTLLIVHAARRWWGFHRRHMILALAEALPDNVATLVVDRPITLDVTTWKDPQAFLSGLWRLECRSDGTRVTVIRPRVLVHDLTARAWSGLRAVNCRLLALQLRGFVRRRFPGLRRSIQWIYHPIQDWVWGSISQAGTVYECYDEYARDIKGEWRARHWRREEATLRSADLVFVTMPLLAETRVRVNPRVVVVPNGIPGFFFAPPTGTGDPLADLPRPRIGYIGNLRPPVDVDVLTSLAQKRRDWQWVFAGPVDRAVGAAALRRLSNVHFVGVRPYEQIPALVCRLDVGLIPFRVNDFSRALNPLKAGEYLACGVPVVGTALPALQSWGDLIWQVPDDAKALETAMEAALASDRQAYAARAIAAARERSWDAIARGIIIPELTRTFGV